MSSVDVSAVSARARTERGKPRTTLDGVSLRADTGVLVVLGSPRDGTSLLFDVIDGTVSPHRGRVEVLGGSPESARRRVSRVSLEAPLPAGLRIEEVCDLGAALRSEPPRPAKERLSILGAAHLAQRRTESLGVAERRTVLLAIALTSTTTEVIVVEEPLVALDGAAPRFVVDALSERGRTACVIVSTASTRDGARLGTSFGLLDRGVYSPVGADAAFAATTCSARLVLPAVVDSSRTAALVATLTNDDAVTTVESVATRGQSVVLQVEGLEPRRLASAITRAVAEAGVDVELIEPRPASVDAVRIAMAARAATEPSRPA